MKKIYMTALSLTLSLAAIVPNFVHATVTVKEVSAATSDVVFESKEKNFSIAYPSSWRKKDMPKLDLVLFAPPKAAAREPEASMNVVSEKVEAGINLDLFYNESVQNLSKALQDVKIEKSGDANLNGVPSKWVSYTHVMQNIKFEVLQYFIVAKDMVYLITFSAKAENFDEFRPTFDKTAATFKLLTAPIVSQG